MTGEPNMADVSVRVGTVADIHVLMELAMMGGEENGFVAPSSKQMLAELYPLLARENGVVGLIGAPGERLQGAVVLRICKMWYSDDYIVEERAIFIHPDYRNAKGGRARKLVEFSKKIADGLDLPLLIGVLSNSRTEGKVRLYERQFGAPAGAFFLYKAKTGVVKEGDDGWR